MRKGRRLRAMLSQRITTGREIFEERFDYQETDDQLRSIQEIKDDMQKSVPMDRLFMRRRRLRKNRSRAESGV